jgi:hypothetical protein
MHKFHTSEGRNFPIGFETHKAILHNSFYDPEVLIIGTYNHGWSWNQADFFYGRDMYMWTALGNLFLYNGNHLTQRRTINHDHPTFEQLFEICSSGKIAFADIVKGVREGIEAVEYANNRTVLVNNGYEWKTRTINNRRVGEYSDIHLDNMGNEGWLDDYVSDIVCFINDTPSIKHIYFTFKTGNWIADKKDEICRNIREGVRPCSIFTPTMNGFRKNLLNPFHERAWSLLHCWVWNGLEHEILVNKPGYGHLDHEWLRDNGVNPNHF